MTLLVDVNLSPAWVESLGRFGVDAIHWSRIGDIRAADDVIFDRASKEGWAILTQDLDFAQILFRTSVSGPSVVLLRLDDDLSPDSQSRVAQIILQHAKQIETGALIVIEPNKFRLRLLPVTG